MSVVLFYDKLENYEVVKITKTFECPAMAYIAADEVKSEAIGDVFLTQGDQTIRITNEEKD